MEILENELLQLNFIKKDGSNSDYIDGAKEAIRFCIRKHKDRWTLEQFESDLKETIAMNVTGMYGKGIIAGLKFNIKTMMEVATNE